MILQDSTTCSLTGTVSSAELCALLPALLALSEQYSFLLQPVPFPRQDIREITWLEIVVIIIVIINIVSMISKDVINILCPGISTCGHRVDTTSLFLENNWRISYVALVLAIDRLGTVVWVNNALVPLTVGPCRIRVPTEAKKPVCIIENNAGASCHRKFENIYIE